MRIKTIDICRIALFVFLSSPYKNNIKVYDTQIDKETLNHEMRKWDAAGYQHAVNINRWLMRQIKFQGKP